MDAKNVVKIRILKLLSKHSFLSAKSISNRVKVSLDDVSSALSELITEGDVVADDTGREWGGEPVILFMLSGVSRKTVSPEWMALINSVKRK